MTTSTTVRCDGVSYRQGFIEVRHGVHAGYVNMETWLVDSTADISRFHTARDGLPDSAVVTNTELELSVASAKTLTRLLQQAIRAIERSHDR